MAGDADSTQDHRSKLHEPKRSSKMAAEVEKGRPVSLELAMEFGLDLV